MGAISEFMTRDHDRLDAILALFEKESDAKTAQRLFSEFDEGLRAHIAWEEDILFPPFEERTGMRDIGPTTIMRMEHGLIKELLDTIVGAIGKSDTHESVAALAELLGAHNVKEENVLYPWLDRSLSHSETNAVMDRISGSRVEA
jgi:iron-sulfur cluster repair protein YtfE (RIC family)